jgi:hypothetical protein
VRVRSLFSPLRWFSAFFLLAALILVTLQLVSFSRVRANFPPGLNIAGVPVGGLNRQEAAQRLLEAYNLPVEVRYNDAVIHLDPAQVDFQLDLDSMLAAAEQQRTQQLFWRGFWDYLWGRSSSPGEIPLRSTYSEDRLRALLMDEIAERYDSPPVAAMPQIGTVNFQPGKPGTQLDVDGSVLILENALRSLHLRQVVLPIKRSSPARPAFQNLEVLLKQTIDLSEFDGLTGVYLLDLQTAQELHFAYRQGENIPVEPDVAFTASSIIKIPIMVSAFRRMGDEPDEEALRLLGEMIIKSGNESADWLMDRVIDSSRGPLLVTEDMHALGLMDTFLAGYFSVGSPLLKEIQTPANQRTDINTDPDPYSQTTTSDIGMLLEDLYQCTESGGGALSAVFPGEITQVECRQMIDLLASDELGLLIQASVPDGTRVAHKHGWVSTFGVINTIGDAGIVYTPGGNYILVISVHHPEQLVWEPASRLIADLGRAVYNYYNVPTE